MDRVSALEFWSLRGCIKYQQQGHSNFQSDLYGIRPLQQCCLVNLIGVRLSQKTETSSVGGYLLHKEGQWNS